MNEDEYRELVLAWGAYISDFGLGAKLEAAADQGRPAVRVDWYELDKELYPLFKEYLILYVAYEIWILKHYNLGKSRLDFQFDFLKDVCERF